MASRSHLRGFAVWIALIDLVALVIGSVAAVILRIGHEDMPDYVYEHIDGWLVFLGSIILANYLAGSYRIQHSFSRFNIVVTWLFSMIFSVLVLSVFSYAWLFTVLLGRGVLLLSIALYSVLSLVFKMIAYHTLFTRDFLLCRTVIIGTGLRAKEVKDMIENRFILPIHKVIAFVSIRDDNAALDPGVPAVIDGIAVVNSTIGMFERIVLNMHADLTIMAFQDRENDKPLYPHLRRLRFEGVETLDTYGAIETYLGKTPLDLIDEDTMTRIVMESSLPVVKRLKRIFDVAVTLLFAPVWIPVGLIIAFLVKCTEPRNPATYSQMRVGQFNELFRIYKFRTMRPGSEDLTGPVWSEEQDRRITPVGRMLRRFRLDEIPQFLNILRGEMSIVGPRPERPELHAELESKIPFFGERANVLPGLTGWAQVRYPYGNTVEDAARKLEYDIYYIKNLSLSLDLQIILRTIRIVLLGLERGE